MTKDWLNLNKLDKELNDVFKSTNLKTKKKSKNKTKFPKPEPRYTKQKPILSKQDQETAKKIIKETGSAFKSVMSKIKNRKAIKLEKEYFKAQEKSEALAHEIKLRTGIEDYKNNITRYEQEIEKQLKKQEKEKEIKHSEACINYNLALESETNQCICEDRK